MALHTNLKRTVATAIVTLAGAINMLAAETVYLSANGKTYHRSETCMALTRSKVKLHAERATAEQHGLKPCGICYRAKSTSSQKQGKNAWATEAK